MERTQIYLTSGEKKALNALAAQSGRKKSELIREAIDRLIEQKTEAHRQQVVAQVAGLWRDRTDWPDLTRLRQSWDRG
jgi:metal-responsive CopG/Arc/MetJ family transcriptional regulator